MYPHPPPPTDTPQLYSLLVWLPMSAVYFSPVKESCTAALVRTQQSCAESYCWGLSLWISSWHAQNVTVTVENQKTRCHSANCLWNKISLRFSRFRVEVNVSPESFSKLHVVDVTWKTIGSKKRLMFSDRSIEDAFEFVFFYLCVSP